MRITPTATSQFVAGMGFWSIIWSTILHLNKIASYLKCDRWISQEAVLAWINRNKTISLVLSEIANLLMHSPENASSTTFCLGGTLMNVLMIFIVLPFRQAAKAGMAWVFGLFIKSEI